MNAQSPSHQPLTAASGSRPDPYRSAAPAQLACREAAVRIVGLTKTYVNPWTLKRTCGLDALDLEVHRGEVFGYLGPNGAGKTTTMKILAGLLKRTSGRAYLLGTSIDDVRSRTSLGFLPEQPYFYDSLTGLEYLEFVARLSGMQAQPASRAARHWLGKVGLGQRERLVLRKYSKGMLQRLGLAAAMVHEPELLILDEPMSGLDPFGRRDVRDLILEQREQGTTVLFSSHILPDVEALCDRVAILLGGRLERVATVGELVEGAAPTIEVSVAGFPLVEVPGAFAGTLRRREAGGTSAFIVGDPARLQEVLGWLLSHGVTVTSVTPQRPSLEQLFMAAAESSAFQAQGVRRQG